MSEAARPATTDDLASIEALLAAVVPDMLSQRGGPIFLVSEAARMQPVADALGDDDALVIVGTYHDAVLGVATMRFVTLDDGQMVGRVERLVVDAAARKSGIGEAIMNSLLDSCRARGCSAIESTALPGDRHTKNFFESFGMKARLLTVMRTLD